MDEKKNEDDGEVEMKEEAENSPSPKREQVIIETLGSLSHGGHAFFRFGDSNESRGSYEDDTRPDSKLLVARFRDRITGNVVNANSQSSVCPCVLVSLCLKFLRV